MGSITNTGVVSGGYVIGGMSEDTITIDPALYNYSTTDSITSSTTASISISGGGAGGGGFITSGAGGTWSTTYPNYSVNNSSYDTKVHINSDGLQMAADSDIKIGDKSLKNILEQLEDKLAILHPNEELESKWEELREARQKYLAIEAELKEKEKMWKILKEK